MRMPGKAVFFIRGNVMGKKEPTEGGELALFLREYRPFDRASLREWIFGCLRMEMPETALCAGHATPLDYLCHSFFEEEGDAVVWACRGGGKTMVGAVATLLDLLFKPGIQVRILGGSFEQSERMYRYLLSLVQAHFSHCLSAQPTQRRLEFTNGSRVEVLAQSDRSVRGQRVQKLRCDEVELFDEGVWQAAQLVTRGIETAKMQHANLKAAKPGEDRSAWERGGVFHDAQAGGVDGEHS